MRRGFTCALAAVVGSLCVAAPAAADPRVVRSGETLWSIAAANNFTTRALAAANGLSEDAPLVAGQTIQIPSVEEARVALERAGFAANGQAPQAPAGYTVEPGDTLSGVAARVGVTTAALAKLNGLDEDAGLLAGAELELPAGAGIGGTPGAELSALAGPVATAEFVSPALVGQVAAQHGVSPSLAAALAKQESGFNNGLVSSADARGVMQLLPDTWGFVQGTLAGYTLDPASATDNVHAGVLYLGQLLRETGGDETLALAAYYQGLASVRSIGVLPETEQYIANVMALRTEFDG